MTDVHGQQLAQVNVALPSAPLDAPSMAGFVKAVGDVNWLADKSPGFVWRLPPEHGPVTFGPLGDDRVIVTLSIWTHFEALQHYVYRTGHALFMHRRSRWFVPLSGFTTAMWWIAEGDRPSVRRGSAASATSACTGRLPMLSLSVASSTRRGPPTAGDRALWLARRRPVVAGERGGGVPTVQRPAGHAASATGPTNASAGAGRSIGRSWCGRRGPDVGHRRARRPAPGTPLAGSAASPPLPVAPRPCPKGSRPP